MNGFCTFRHYLKVRTVKIGNPELRERGICEPIDPGTIHVWSSDYAELEPDFAFLSLQLSHGEMAKAKGYKKPADSRDYILRHGMVRTVLGGYLGMEPDKIRFVIGTNGKPGLDPEGLFSDIRFSLSRTDAGICLGITRQSGIGLDIVKFQPRYPFSRVEHYLFTPGEKAWIAQPAPDRRAERFFRVWSLKEALLKATGGNARMMQELDVSGILTGTYLNGWYPLHVENGELFFGIHEADCGAGHHRVIATLPE